MDGIQANGRLHQKYNNNYNVAIQKLPTYDLIWHGMHSTTMGMMSVCAEMSLKVCTIFSLNLSIKNGNEQNVFGIQNTKRIKHE